jgi:preprotein translocase subunit SecD
MSVVAKKTRNIFYTIIGLTLVCLTINLPAKMTIFGHTFYRPNLSLNIGSIKIQKNLDLKYGLDLAGGASLIYNIDTSKVTKDNLASALDSLKSNIERRVNLFGVSEVNVQLSAVGEKHRLTVDLPGVSDVTQAIGLIGQTAKLSFRGEDSTVTSATTSATFADAFPFDTGLNGSHLTKASVQINPNNSQPEVALEFNSEGTKLFADATTKYLNHRIAIFLDDIPVTYPTVNTVIPDGKAVISGSFDIQTAKTLAAQLNAGALPLPITLIQQTSVGATLGKDSINKGILAGLVGLGLVCLFMIGNYGYLGFIADISLIIYGLITLTLYRLIPVTLTFPGIVGFILSVGMAVDSNILIFERMREEIRLGKDWNMAMEQGFTMAWNSIRDANTCTIITGLILFNPFNWPFLNTSGMVRGFAITLVLGIILGIFTGVFVTRNLLRVLAKKSQSYDKK